MTDELVVGVVVGQVVDDNQRVKQCHAKNQHNLGGT
jgi:hypothetical protein